METEVRPILKEIPDSLLKQINKRISKKHPILNIIQIPLIKIRNFLLRFHLLQQKTNKPFTKFIISKEIIS